MAVSPGDKHRKAKDFINRWCDKSKLKVDEVDWATASDPSLQYNCFGFAVGNLRWWQPPYLIKGVVANPTNHWPRGVRQDTTIHAFVEAARTQGFLDSVDGAWEEGWETIVLYYKTEDNEFKHAARQKSPGVWESKLGPLSDIEHPFDGVDNAWYGSGRVFMKRPWPYYGPLFTQPAPRSE